ncbi:MAG TPA: trypsin-like peptidase domain-containing protein [Victivallales bacterium]|nr:trypsin-like peptidase domain-containing protein [Victivallales bacterium]
MKKKIFILLALLTGFCYGIFENSVFADIKILRSMEETLSSVSEKSFQSVVVITTTKKVTPRRTPFDFLPNSPYFERFRRRMPQQENNSPELLGGGSGFLVSQDGYIISNHHVIKDSDEISVRLNDKREFKADLVGSDPKTDIAVLKINADKLPFLEFADSDKVKIGNFCIAVGAPFMLDYTMTFGIVSQKGRQVGMNFYESYIQTDAAINVGNSGGPLLDVEGKVIGVNDFIVSGSPSSPGNIGLGFAIPSNMVKNVYEQIVKNGSVIRPWVGIGMDDLGSEAKKSYSIENGVHVREVYEGNPADKAGIEPGDIILSVSGSKVDSTREVQEAVLKHKPGDIIKFEITRDGKKREILVTAAKQADNMDIGGESTGFEGEEAYDFGMKFGEENGQLIVSEVLDGSYAQIAGVEPGYSVISVNKKIVRNLSDLKAALKESKDEISIVLSDGTRRKIFVIKK